MPLQEAELLELAGLFDLQCGEHIVLLSRHGRHTAQGWCTVDRDAVMLNSLERLQGPLRRHARVGATQAHAHHPVQD